MRHFGNSSAAAKRRAFNVKWRQIEGVLNRTFHKWGWTPGALVAVNPALFLSVKPSLDIEDWRRFHAAYDEKGVSVPLCTPFVFRHNFTFFVLGKQLYEASKRN